jgi:hypothetical protein
MSNCKHNIINQLKTSYIVVDTEAQRTHNQHLFLCASAPLRLNMFQKIVSKKIKLSTIIYMS